MILLLSGPPSFYLLMSTLWSWGALLTGKTPLSPRCCLECLMPYVFHCEDQFPDYLEHDLACGLTCPWGRFCAPQAPKLHWGGKGSRVVWLFPGRGQHEAARGLGCPAVFKGVWERRLPAEQLWGRAQMCHYPRPWVSADQEVIFPFLFWFTYKCVEV